MDVISLVRYLRDDARTRPVAVLTVDRDQYGPYVDAEKLRRKAGGNVDVVTIPTDELTRAMSELLEDQRAGVYRGACRVYPPGTQWERDPFPVRFARNSREIDDLPRVLVLDVKNARHRTARASRSGSSGSPARPGPRETRTGAPVPDLPAVPRDIATRDQAEKLMLLLRSSSRRIPAVVVSRAVGASEAYADVDGLERDLEGLATVFEITTMDASWGFSDVMRDRCQVYGGAGRVYPVGTAWEQDPYASPLHFAHSTADRSRITRALVGDVMRMASARTLTLNAPAEQSARVAGEVVGVLAERGVVKLDDQRMSVVWPELIAPGVPAERLFATGMRIEGLLDPESRRIDVRGMRRTPEESLRDYRPGDTVLVQVVGVEADSCTVEPFPDFSVTVAAADITDDGTDLRDLTTEGEVLAALLVAIEPSGEWRLSVAEAAEPPEAVPAPSILVGGPAWLVPPEPVRPESEVEPEQASPNEPDAEQSESGPAPGITPLDEARQRERAQLIRELEQERQANTRLQHKLQSTRAQLLKAKKRKGGDVATGPDDSHLFEDPGQQLDFEIRLAWARMTLPSEKKDLPLKAWTYGPHFLDTLHELEGVSRHKVVEVLVHVLTGRDTELASRERHQLRTGCGGDDAPVTRRGGESCWRVNLQTNTPGARRLHYWSCADGSIELSSVRVHDDFRA